MTCGVCLAKYDDSVVRVGKDYGKFTWLFVKEMVLPSKLLFDVCVLGKKLGPLEKWQEMFRVILIVAMVVYAILAFWVYWSRCNRLVVSPHAQKQQQQV